VRAFSTEKGNDEDGKKNEKKVEPTRYERKRPTSTAVSVLSRPQ
jgi:hypothetical protein